MATTIHQQKIKSSEVEEIGGACNTMIGFERDQWSLRIEKTNSKRTHNINIICISEDPILSYRKTSTKGHSAKIVRDTRDVKDFLY